MADTDETKGGAAEGASDAGHGSDAAGAEEAELQAEEESAKAMEAEVPHSTGYPEAGQEPAAGSGQGRSS
jgi:hypothetical protein